MTRPLLSAVLILKNEESVVEKTLDSCIGAADRVTVVLDSATTDQTMRVVAEWARRNQMPLRMLHAAFDGYAAQRNKALDHDAEAENPSVFTLSMSADETLSGAAELRSYLEPRRDDEEDGAYLVTMQTGERRWPYSRVLRTDAKWRYKGKVHEMPESPSGESEPRCLIPNVSITHSESDPERKARRMREYDLPVLTAQVEDETLSLVDRARPLWFLAETHLYLAHFSPKNDEDENIVGGAWLTHYLQAMGYYWRHGELSERQEGQIAKDSAMRAYFMHYYCGLKAGVWSAGEVEPRLASLVESAPDLAEAKLLLAQCAAQRDARSGLFLALQANTAAERNEKRRNEVRFVQQDTHVKWSALALAADCAMHLGNGKQAKSLALRAIAAGCPKERFKFEEKGE